MHATPSHEYMGDGCGNCFFFVFFKVVICGWSVGCDEGAEVTDHKEWPQSISIHSNLRKKQHSVNIPQLTKVPIQEPTCLFMVNSLHVPITVPF